MVHLSEAKKAGTKRKTVACAHKDKEHAQLLPAHS